MIDQESVTNQEPLLKSKDVCTWLNISEATLSRMIAEKEITAYRIRGEHRFKRQHVQSYLDSQCTTNNNQEKK